MPIEHPPSPADSFKSSAGRVAGWCRGWWRDWGIFGVVSAVVLVALAWAAVSLLWVGVDGARAHYHGIAGTVTVEDCEWVPSRTGGGWDCTGDFVSDDGVVLIEMIQINPHLSEWPAEAVPARVSGVRATYARALEREYQWVQQLLAGLFFVGFAAWIYGPLWLPSVTDAGQQNSQALLVRRRDLVRGRRLRGIDVPIPSRPPRTPAVSPVSPAEPPVRAPSPMVYGPPPRASPETVQTMPRRQRVRGAWTVPAVVVSYLVLVAGSVWYAWSLVEWNRAQDARLTATITAEVTATHLGNHNRIEVAWTDAAGDGWTMRLTPYEPDQWSVGDTVDLRYDPAHPDEIFPVGTSEFEGFTRDRLFWAGLLLLPGVLLAWAWTWRLGRWLFGMARVGRPADVEVLAATYLIPIRREQVPEPAAFWLRIRESNGRTWYQRAMWSPRLVSFAYTRPLGNRTNATFRSCPGLRRMYLVEIPEMGRIWPASTARAHMPAHYWLEPLAPGPTGMAHRPRSNLVMGGLALPVLLLMMFFLAGPGGVAYLAAFGVAGWLWLGATPIQGIRGSGKPGYPD